jgi:type IV secretion system protein VirB10
MTMSRRTGRSGGAPAGTISQLAAVTFKRAAPRAVVSLLVASLALAACNDEDKEDADAKAQKSSSKIANDLYDFELAPPAPPPPAPPPPAPPPLPRQVVHVPEPPPPPPPPPIVFEDPGPLLRAQRARELRGLRQQAATLYEPSAPIGPPATPLDVNWRLKDPDYQQRDPKAPEDRSTLPVDRYRVITADRYIGAVLENSVNSQIPGRIIAIVERNIYGADGRRALLPKGTRIICSYQSLAKVGDTRLNVGCARAIRPDGASVMLTDAQGADQMARTGLAGDVDVRMWERYGSAFLVAAISSLASLGNQVSTNQNVQNGSNALSQNLGQVTAKVLEQSVNLAPIVTVPAGSRIQIIPQTDLWIREPEQVSPQTTAGAE